MYVVGDSKLLNITNITKRKSNGPDSPSEGKAVLDSGHSANLAESKGKGFLVEGRIVTKPHESKSLGTQQLSSKSLSPMTCMTAAGSHQQATTH